MILKYLSLVFFVFGLFSGCSEKNEMPRDPKYQTKGCLHGCRGLPCDKSEIKEIKTGAPKGAPVFRE